MSPITVSSPLSAERLNDMLLRLHMRAGAVITIRHDLALEDLQHQLMRLHEVFARAGICLMSAIERGDVGFERVSGAIESATESLLKLSKGFEDSKVQASMAALKQTAWERRNPNAPWYRRFQSKRRPSLANRRQ